MVVSVEIEPRYLGKVSGDVPFRELIEYDGNFLHAQHKVLCGSRASHRRHALCKRRVFPNGIIATGMLQEVRDKAVSRLVLAEIRIVFA